jgi:hypothetical protein
MGSRRIVHFTEGCFFLLGGEDVRSCSLFEIERSHTFVSAHPLFLRVVLPVSSQSHLFPFVIVSDFLVVISISISIKVCLGSCSLIALQI